MAAGSALESRTSGPANEIPSSDSANTQYGLRDMTKKRAGALKHRLFFQTTLVGLLRFDQSHFGGGTARVSQDLVVVKMAVRRVASAHATVVAQQRHTCVGNDANIAQSASQGAITARQLDNRPMMRTGEVLETVPGVVISQHSGEGKANQYYLRGFNLDHGTDFATTVAGMPVNMPTHAHGHGYSDLNWLIPELVDRIAYKKGPYFADEGDFASANRPLTRSTRAPRRNAASVKAYPMRPLERLVR